jgi:predicted GIY-YIG superfamily endonuclease
MKNRKLGSSEIIRVIRIDKDYRLAIMSNSVTIINTRKYTQIIDAVSQLKKIKVRNNINEQYWYSSNEQPQGNYLFRINGKKQKAHIWDGEDTFCKMWSTGGINSKSENFSLFNSEMNKDVCSLCSSKLQEHSYFFPKETNDSSIIKVKHFDITNDDQYNREDEIYIYTLQLSNDKFYVGQTINPDNRIKKHFTNRGSAWTKINQPKSVISIIKANTRNWKAAEKIENKATIYLMIKYGWENVRGGFWSNRDEKTTLTSLANHREYIEALGYQYLTVVKP